MSARRRALVALGVLMIVAVTGSCTQEAPVDEPSTVTSASPDASLATTTPIQPTPASSGPGATGAGSAPSGGSPAMAALGDSITAAVNATQPLLAQPEYSWSTGTDPGVNSVLTRLRAGQPNLRATNLAVPGARIRDLAGQAAGLPAGTDLVTVLIGANDACTSTVAGMTSVDSFRAAARAGLAAIARAGVGTIVVASVPDLHRLWQIGAESSAAVATWTAFGICQSMLADPLSRAAPDEARRDQVRARVAAYDRILAAECRAITAVGSATTCRFDGRAVTDSRFTLADLSTIDYFHPSPAGQARLASAVYAAALPTD